LDIVPAQMVATAQNMGGE